VKGKLNVDLGLAIVGLLSVATGMDISISGQLRHLMLADERYFVGGVLIVGGLYCSYVALRRGRGG